MTTESASKSVVVRILLPYAFSTSESRQFNSGMTFLELSFATPPFPPRISEPSSSAMPFSIISYFHKHRKVKHYLSISQSSFWFISPGRANGTSSWSPSATNFIEFKQSHLHFICACDDFSNTFRCLLQLIVGESGFTETSFQGRFLCRKCFGFGFKRL